MRETVVRRLREAAGVARWRHERRATDQVGRLLALVPYLQARREVPSSRPRPTSGCSPAQIVKDLNVLWFCGLPGLGMGDLIDVDMDALEGEGVIRLSNADYLSRPLRLDTAGGLRADRRAAGPAARAATTTCGRVVDRTLGKLEARRRGRRGASPRRCDIRLARAASGRSTRSATGSPRAVEPGAGRCG